MLKPKEGTIAIIKQICECASSQQACKPFLTGKPIKMLAWTLGVNTRLTAKKVGDFLSRNNEWTGDKGLMNYPNLCLFTNIQFQQMALNSI